MRIQDRLPAILALFVSGAFGQVQITPGSGGQYNVDINGKPFTVFYTAPDEPKPYLAPLRAASGKLVTRQYPMVKDLGESTDHPHHRGVWLGYKDVNGFNFWENELAYHNPKAGKVVAAEVKIEGPSIKGSFDWLAPTGEKVLREDRTMKFSGDATTRSIDFDITLTAEQPVTFGDDKDGAFAIRLADGLTELKGHGVLSNSAGLHTMKELWGKQADWVDDSGILEGEPLGVLMMEHPKSFRHPSRWHARDYGLLAVNPFAAHAYDAEAPPLKITLRQGESAHLRYRILVHGKISAEDASGYYRSWVSAD